VSERTVGERLRQAGARLRPLLDSDFRPEAAPALNPDAIGETYAKR
jgi:hypothetical protein